MENVKYIPGDLVMMDNQHPYAQKGAVYVVRRADWFECGEDYFNNKRPYKASYILIEYNYLIKGYDPNCIGAKQFGVPSIYVEPIPITPEILEKNGWIHDGEDKYVKCSIYRNNFDVCHHYLIKYYHTQKECNVLDAYSEKNIKSGISYCHQLQHLLFGLGLPSDLKV